MARVGWCRAVSRREIRRTCYAAIRARALACAQRLARDGMQLGDRIATLAWNTERHLELWYGATGLGAIYHTVNPRLFEEQIVYTSIMRRTA